MHWRQVIAEEWNRIWLTFRRFLKTDRAVLVASISIALFFWLVTKMSKDYETIREVSIQYDLPAGKTFLNTPASSVRARIKSGGWTLFFNYMKGGFPSVRYPLESSNRQSLSSTSIINKISSSIDSKYEVLSVESDIITVQLDDAVTKKVPVEMDVQVEILHGFLPADSIRVQPDTFILEGPASLLEKLDRYPTEAVRIPELSGSFSQKVRPLTPENPQLKISPAEIIVTNTIEKATEGELVIPIEVKNALADSVSIMPSHVFLKYRAPLSLFPDISRADFAVVLDLEGVSPHTDHNVQVPQVVRKPKFTHIVGISPQAVQYFFVEKKVHETSN